jgi:quercetin dioxygenase-like cupin family protein
MGDKKGATKKMSNEITSPKPFKHAPSVEISTWYKGILTTLLATDDNTGGAFDFVLSNMRSRTEPPPHVHSREHEFMYVLDGKLEVYVGNDVFQVGPGECVFFPVGKPHAFLIRSPMIRMLVLVTPGGLLKTLALMSAPAEKLEIPSDTVTYATADLEETISTFLKHGVRFLSLEEIAVQMPAFPLRSAA